MISRYTKFILILYFSVANAQEVKWMSIGDLHNWYSAAGSEIEVGRTGQVSDQQDGCVILLSTEFRIIKLQRDYGLEHPIFMIQWLIKIMIKK